MRAYTVKRVEASKDVYGNRPYWLNKEYFCWPCYRWRDSNPCRICGTKSSDEPIRIEVFDHKIIEVEQL